MEDNLSYADKTRINLHNVPPRMSCRTGMVEAFFQQIQVKLSSSSSAYAPEPRRTKTKCRSEGAVGEKKGDRK
jgi:hypothetical protein